jgi:hypothetical protein
MLLRLLHLSLCASLPLSILTFPSDSQPSATRNNNISFLGAKLQNLSSKETLNGPRKKKNLNYFIKSSKQSKCPQCYIGTVVMVKRNKKTEKAVKERQEENANLVKNRRSRARLNDCNTRTRTRTRRGWRNLISPSQRAREREKRERILLLWKMN